MRTLKKTMCFVLALVMMLGLCAVSASATDFTDDAQINETFEEAVEVLDGIGVFKGYPNGSFQPKGDITRAEVAAILYRVVTGDVKDVQAGIYADGKQFTDIEGHWAAGYINYVAIADLVKGRGDDTFDPDNNVNGYEVLAMFLRAIGYGKNGEFEGASWMINTASYAKQLGITDKINTSTLGLPATREMVAEMIFQAIQQPKVTWSQLTGYNPNTTLWGTTPNTSLATDMFNLTGGTYITDDWGRPEKVWTATKPSAVTITIPVAPVITYHDAVLECDVFADVIGASRKSNDSFTADAYINGKYDNPASGSTQGTVSGKSTQVVEATDTSNKLGAKGRLMEVYEYGATPSYTIVYIDTLLALVTDVADAKYDNAGHLDTEAALTLTIYDRDGASNNRVVLNGEESWGYSKNDYVLVYATQNGNQVRSRSGVTVGGVAVGLHIEVLREAPVADTARQTAYSATDKTTTIGGVTYNWANRYHMTTNPKTGGNNTTYSVLTDLYGNIIGKAAPATVYNYGIIEAIAWDTSTSLLNDAHTYAQLVFANSEKSGIVQMSTWHTGAAFTNGGNTTATAPAVSTDKDKNTAYHNTIYQFTESNGVYSVAAAGAAGTVANIKQGEPTDVTYNTSSHAHTNDSTVYLVKTLDTDGNDVYSTYTGYKTVPSLNVTSVSVLVNATGYVTYMYVDATSATATTSSFIAFIPDATADAVIGTKNAYDMYVNGEVKRYTDSGTVVSSDASTPGLYTVTLDTNGEISAVAALTAPSSDTKVYEMFESGTAVTAAKLEGTTLVLTVSGTEYNYNATDAVYYDISGTLTLKTADQAMTALATGADTLWLIKGDAGEDYVSFVYYKLN